MTDPLPIPPAWPLADHDRDRYHPLVQAAAAVANMTGAPVRAYTWDDPDTNSTSVALVVNRAHTEHISPGELMADPRSLEAMAPMFAGPLRQIADELVAVAAALNSEANRLDEWSKTVTLGDRAGEAR